MLQREVSQRTVAGVLVVSHDLSPGLRNHFQETGRVNKRHGGRWQMARTEHISDYVSKQTSKIECYTSSNIYQKCLWGYCLYTGSDKTTRPINTPNGIGVKRVRIIRVSPYNPDMFHSIPVVRISHWVLSTLDCIHLESQGNIWTNI